MIKNIQRLWRLSYQRSPQENLKSFRKKLEARLNKNEQFENDSFEEVNQVIPNIWEQTIYQKFIAYKLKSSNKSIILLGELDKINRLETVLRNYNIDVKSLEWTWGTDIHLNSSSPDFQLLVCSIPLSEHEWQAFLRMKEKYPGRVMGVYEVVLPFSLIPVAQSSLDYYVKTLEEISPYYLGETYFSQMDKLNKVFPLVDKKVIEFGPFDGCQTAGLVNSGVKSLTCIEARADNAIKTMIVRYAFDWDNVELVMDDFHNVTSLKYGFYDLAFAHGVYYHSIAPFLFLENLMSLSNNIFLGGFCATEYLPVGDYELLVYCGRQYRVKMYKECDNFTAGVNKRGYFFHKDDLISFFKERNYEVLVISDEEMDVTAGNYLRFLACKK